VSAACRYSSSMIPRPSCCRSISDSRQAAHTHTHIYTPGSATVHLHVVYANEHSRLNKWMEYWIVRC
jgi:hypothetical protein